MKIRFIWETYFCSLPFRTKVLQTVDKIQIRVQKYFFLRTQISFHLNEEMSQNASSYFACWNCLLPVNLFQSARLTSGVSLSIFRFSTPPLLCLSPHTQNIECRLAFYDFHPLSSFWIHTVTIIETAFTFQENKQSLHTVEFTDW